MKKRILDLIKKFVGVKGLFVIITVAAFFFYKVDFLYPFIALSLMVGTREIYKLFAMSKGIKIE
jgi:hypothetical protein